MKYRSVLFVPGHEEKKIRKAYTLNPDLIVIDLESTCLLYTSDAADE